MKGIHKYLPTAVLSFAYAAPALAAGLVLPSAPVGPGPGVTASSLVNIITTAVNYIMIVSVVIAVGMFVWGGIKYATGDAKAKDILKNAAIGLVAILGVGLVVRTIADWVGRGGQLG